MTIEKMGKDAELKARLKQIFKGSEIVRIDRIRPADLPFRLAKEAAKQNEYTSPYEAGAKMGQAAKMIVDQLRIIPQETGVFSNYNSETGSVDVFVAFAFSSETFERVSAATRMYSHSSPAGGDSEAVEEKSQFEALAESKRSSGVLTVGPFKYAAMVGEVNFEQILFQLKGGLAGIYGGIGEDF